MPNPLRPSMLLRDHPHFQASRGRLSDAIYPNFDATSLLQQRAALRAQRLMGQMGPEGSMSTDDRYKENFLGTKYGNAQHIEAYPAMRLLNQTANVAEVARKRKR